MKKQIDLEICIETISEFLMANTLPVKRCELCAALDVGGVTPSLGFINEVSMQSNIEVHVMIRPRAGNFIYSDDEKEIMLQTTKWVCEKGVSGIVFGALNSEGFVDLDFAKKIVMIAKNYGKETTFHRAIDFSKDPLHVVETCIELEVDRILTSGAADSAISGKKMIQDMVENADGAIQIMAGGGVNDGNAVELAHTGVDSLHFTSRNKRDGELPGMGADIEPDESKIWSVIDALRTEGYYPPA